MSSPNDAPGATARPGGPIPGKAYLLLTFTMICWGGNAVASRMAVGLVSPMVLVAARWLVVVLVLAVLMRRQFFEAWPELRRRRGYVVAMGALGYTAFNALFYAAGHSTSAVNLGIIQGAIPVFVLLGAFLLHRVRASGLQIAGIVVTIVGVALVASGGRLETLLTLTIAQGDLMMILGCALYAGYTINLRHRPKVSGIGFFCGLALAALVSSLPLVAVEAALGDAVWPTTLQGLAIVLYAGLFPSFLAQVAFIRSVAQLGPGRAGIFVNLVPIFASLLAVVILQEPFELFHALALALVVGGIYLAERSPAARAAASQGGTPG